MGGPFWVSVEVEPNMFSIRLVHVFKWLIILRFLCRTFEPKFTQVKFHKNPFLTKVWVSNSRDCMATIVTFLHA